MGVKIIPKLEAERLLQDAIFEFECVSFSVSGDTRAIILNLLNNYLSSFSIYSGVFDPRERR